MEIFKIEFKITQHLLINIFPVQPKIRYLDNSYNFRKISHFKCKLVQSFQLLSSLPEKLNQFPFTHFTDKDAKKIKIYKQVEDPTQIWD